MKLEISVAEATALFKEIQHGPEKLFEMIRQDVRHRIGEYLSALMETELTHHLGRKPYERCKQEINHRNGSYGRHYTLKGLGKVEVQVPRDRNGTFQTEVIPRSKQYEDDIRQDLSMMFLTGISTRSLSLLSKRLIGRSLSHGEVSKVNGELTDAVDRWRMRDLSQESIKYMVIDGVNFRMHIRSSIEIVPVLVAIGVSTTGHRLVLGLQSGDKESATSWREFFKDLKARGLNPHDVVLGIMDGLPSLEKVFKEEFSRAKVQRCQVHVARNVLAKVTRKLKKPVADDMRSIFYASSKQKALAFFDEFKNRWEKDTPSAVACLERSLDSCLTFFNFAEDEWISLRTTNIIERLNKEFKRRTKPMEILAGEVCCYRLLAFISLKMELAWRANPIGKVRPNLPLFQKYAQQEFTQKS